MSPYVIAIWLGNLTCDAIGQLAFKAAACGTEEAAGLVHPLATIRNTWTWLGIVAYIGEFVLWLAFLSFVPLSTAILLGSVNILVVMVGGRLCFGEPLTLRRCIAAMLIIGGVVFVGLG